MKLLNGKNILIVGVANKHSIASGIAESMAENGANIALTYQNERLQKNVEKLGSNWGVETFLACDVSRDEEIENTFEQLSKKWDGLDAVIHAVGFAPRDELDGDFMDVTSREGFSIAHDISSYSFIALAKGAKNMMKGRNGSLLTLSYLGSKMTLPNYNVKTLAASGVKNFRKMLSYNANRAPLGRNITTKEVGDAATFLSSDMASGISGEILYVDAGFNITAMGSIEEAES